MKYRLISKPVDAYQYTGHNAEEFVERFGAEVFEDGTIGVSTNPHLWVSVQVSDWVVSNDTGKLIVVPDFAFKSRYEPAE